MRREQGWAAATYVLQHTHRTEVLATTELAAVQPSTVIVKPFKITVHMAHCKNPIKLQLTTDCPVAGLLALMTEILYHIHSTDQMLS